MSRKHGKAVIVTIICKQLGKGEKEARNLSPLLFRFIEGKQSRLRQLK
ncbi:hypothetical protein SRABI134_01408 [Peribacillus sp. Bi134]|nr:hypothetical protein SRABI134_01408 [Peribacillus sp. Bi134]